MSNGIVVDLICEDNAQESCLRPLLERLAREHGQEPRVRVMSARGGAPRVKAGVELWKVAIDRGGRTRPDILVVGHDANCRGYQTVEEQVRDWASPEWEHILVPACPAPHMERWYVLEQTGFLGVVGGDRTAVPDKCDRDFYKRLLREAVEAAGHQSPAGGVEFGPDLANKIDLYRLSREDSSFRSFVDAFRERLRQPLPESGEAPS